MALEPVPAMPPLVVVAHDSPGTADSLRHAVETSAGWRVVVADPRPAGVAAALATGPSVALIGCAVLHNVPTGCRIPLVAIGDDDRPADVAAALAAGARSLLAWPDGAADLPGELARVAATGQPSSAGGGDGLVVAARGVQGGAGTTTVAAHLAAAWARWGPAPVLLVDLAGGLAFRLDLGEAPTWSTLAPATGTILEGTYPLRPLPDATLGGVAALPGSAASPGAEPVLPLGGTEPAAAGIPWLPEGGDPSSAAVRRFPEGDDPSGAATGMATEGLAPPSEAVAGRLMDGGGRLGHGTAGISLDVGALVGAVAQPWVGLAVLPLAGLVDGAPDPPPEPQVVQAVLEAARTTYRLVVVDLPATDGPAIQAALSQADALVAVGRCESAGVRGLQAALAVWRAAGRDPDTAGAVVTGVRPQAPLAPREVRATLWDHLWGLIPAAAAELAAAAEDGVLLLDRHDLPAVQAMLTLANRVVPFVAVSA
jgi:cellulose biosynthesis protein BcsQ